MRDFVNLQRCQILLVQQAKVWWKYILHGMPEEGVTHTEAQSCKVLGYNNTLTNPDREIGVSIRLVGVKKSQEFFSDNRNLI